MLTILFSCVDNENTLVTQTAPVNIYDSTIPANGFVGQALQLQLKAQATNGCYSHVQATLIEIDNRHFLIKAKGLFKTNGICQDVIVYKDTILNFTPPSTGVYYFQINERPFEIRNEVIEVN